MCCSTFLLKMFSMLMVWEAFVIEKKVQLNDIHQHFLKRKKCIVKCINYEEMFNILQFTICCQYLNYIVSYVPTATGMSILHTEGKNKFMSY